MVNVTLISGHVKYRTSWWQFLMHKSASQSSLDKDAKVLCFPSSILDARFIGLVMLLCYAGDARGAAMPKRITLRIEL